VILSVLFVMGFERRLSHRTVIEHLSGKPIPLGAVVNDISTFLNIMLEENDFYNYRDSLVNGNEYSSKEFRKSFLLFREMEQLALNKQTQQGLSVITTYMGDFDSIYATFKDRSAAFYQSEGYLTSYQYIIYPEGWTDHDKIYSTIGIAMMISQIVRFQKLDEKVESNGLFVKKQAEIFNRQRVLNWYFFGAYAVGTLLLGWRWININIFFWPNNRIGLKRK
jgi:hypothetical protein